MRASRRGGVDAPAVARPRLPESRGPFARGRPRRPRGMQRDAPRGVHGGALLRRRAALETRDVHGGALLKKRRLADLAAPPHAAAAPPHPAVAAAVPTPAPTPVPTTVPSTAAALAAAPHASVTPPHAADAALAADAAVAAAAAALAAASLAARAARKTAKTIDAQCEPELHLWLEDEQTLKLAHDLAQLGLASPRLLAARYVRARVKCLFEWQVECLNVDGGAPLDGASLVYSAPPSGGKTMVAEVLVAKALLPSAGPSVSGRSPAEALGSDSKAPEVPPKLASKRTALFVVPFVALAQEKARHFAERWSGDGSYGFRVRAVFGDEVAKGSKVDAKAPRGKKTLPILLADDYATDVAVCTWEKAEQFIDMLLERGGVAEVRRRVAIVVIDEVHLIGKDQRGAVLEALLAKLVLCQRAHDDADPAVPADGAATPAMAAPADAQAAAPLDDATALAPADAAVAPTEGGAAPAEGAAAPAVAAPAAATPTVAGAVRRLVPQLVAMTATASNLDVVARWLGASLYLTTFKPTDLQITLVLPPSSTALVIREPSWTAPLSRWCDNSKRLVDGGRSVGGAAAPQRLKVYAVWRPKEENWVYAERAAVLQLVADNAGRGTLVFCKSRADAETVAYDICIKLDARGRPAPPRAASHATPPRATAGPPRATSASLPTGPRATSHAGSAAGATGARVSQVPLSARPAAAPVRAVDNRRRLLQRELRAAAPPASPQARLLERLVLRGVAFHHAGLCSAQRALLEAAFRVSPARGEATLTCVVATSTLATGINLPASRVVVCGLGGRTTAAELRQSCGRAGRTGLVGSGDAFIVCGTKWSADNAAGLLAADFAAIETSFGGASNAAPNDMFTKLILDAHCSAMANSGLSKCTLFGASLDEAGDSRDASAEAWLVRHAFLERCTDGLRATQLGRATHRCGLKPADALEAVGALRCAGGLDCGSFSATTKELHRCYLIAPLLGSKFILNYREDWEAFQAAYKDASDDDGVRGLATIVGADPSKYAAKRIHQDAAKASASLGTARLAHVSPGTIEVVHQRLCLALLLHERVAASPRTKFASVLLHHKPTLKVSPGDIEGLLFEAATLSKCLAKFCRELRWFKQAKAVASMFEKLSLGAPDHLLPLLKASERINASCAKHLHAAGFDDARALAASDTAAIAEVLSTPARRRRRER
ncbi:hypothetical protein M885DRAFT_510104 [Pelagophyceae sp. CCMP2097]|nr:hypothetical protein M885DRAFT_510104 [Pelagophyceae sp. CCMP2097]